MSICQRTGNCSDACRCEECRRTGGDDTGRLVRHRGGKWLWTWSLDADEWNGCCDTLEEAIEDAMKSLEWEVVAPGSPCYFAHGRKLPKAECDEWGLDWPWYQVDREAALKIFMPNDRTE